MTKRLFISLVVLMLIGACQIPGMGTATPLPTAVPTSDTSSEEASGPVLPAISYEDLTQEIDRSGAVGIAIGDADAPVTLVEYSDFSCPHCFNLYPVIGQLIEDYAAHGNLRVVLKPISFVNPTYSEPAARAAVCAGEQGKGWDMVDQIWNIGSSLGPYAYEQEIFEGRVGDLGLDVDAFSDCFTSPDTAADVQAVIDEAMELGINGVPALFVNEKPVQLAEDVQEVMTREIEAQLGQ